MGRAVGLLRLRQLPDYLVNSHATRIPVRTQTQTPNSTETQNSRIFRRGVTQLSQVGGAAPAVTDGTSIGNLLLLRGFSQRSSLALWRENAPEE
jgi:hypothetical protein